MRLIKSLFTALMVTIVTTIAGSAITHIFDETQEVQSYIMSFLPFLGTTAHAMGLQGTEDDTPDANHTFTTSLNTHTPSTVIDEENPATPVNDSSQSPKQEEQEQSVYENILLGLVPVSGEWVDYEKVLGLKDEQIKQMIENDGMTIWDIAAQQKETKLLEDTYYAAYPAIIIDLLDQGLIDQGTADTLISLSSADIAEHVNVSVEEMIENLINSD